MRVRVVWGFEVTMASFSPIRALSRLDLPTLGLPTMATKRDLVPVEEVKAARSFSVMEYEEIPSRRRGQQQRQTVPGLSLIHI